MLGVFLFVEQLDTGLVEVMVTLLALSPRVAGSNPVESTTARHQKRRRPGGAFVWKEKLLWFWNMIEVEKKFRLEDGQAEALIEGAEFVHEASFRDVYFDTEEFELTTQDMWLRKRDDRFELKVGAYVDGKRLADQYEEIGDEAAIARRIGLREDIPIEDAMRERGLEPFCDFTTTRRKYRSGEFIIDLDTVVFDTFTYRIGEIELMVNDSAEIETAVSRIIAFAEYKNLALTAVRGKVFEYLRRSKPEHFEVLAQIGLTNRE